MPDEHARKAPQEKVPFELATTKECPNCSGAGELYELEHEYHPNTWDSGTSLLERVNEGGWSFTDREKMCPRCEGFGRVNDHV